MIFLIFPFKCAKQTHAKLEISAGSELDHQSIREDQTLLHYHHTPYFPFLGDKIRNVFLKNGPIPASL